jgi:hypothetical protein
MIGKVPAITDGFGCRPSGFFSGGLEQVFASIRTHK